MAAFTSPTSTITFNPNKPTSSFFFPSPKPSQSHFPSHQLVSYKSIKCSLSHGQQRPEYIPNRISDPSYVRTFDTTLRDGEQSPGATMTSKEKLDVARQLAKLGVDIIEAGFPASSKDDLEAVRLIAKEVGNTIDDDGYVPVICGLARCNRTDIDAAWEAVKYAKRPRIHTFIATSEIHLKHKLRKSREEVIAIAREMVSYARSLGCEDVEFSPEDAGRSDREFLYRILEEVIKAGATTLNIPDTVGYTLPTEFGQLIADIKSNTPGIENVIISTHCQNDLGLSTANTLAGAYAGARQVEVTINGIGERAGNASLEEVVMAIKCRGKEQLEGLYTGVNTRHIVMSSKMRADPVSLSYLGIIGPRIELMSHWKAPFGVPAAQVDGDSTYYFVVFYARNVAEYTGLHVQLHKAIVGANAFAHESGIHQDGMLKFKGTYEIISPEDIGLSRSNDSGIVLGKLSGRHALRSRLLELGYELDGKELDDVFWRFKAVAEKKKHLSDDDLEALISDEIFQPQVIWSLGDLQIACGTLGLSTATVKLIGIDGEEHVACSVGTGPVDAAYKAIDLIVKVPVTLLEYSVNSVTEGIDAIASNRVVIRGDNGHTITHAFTEETIHRTFSGNGAGMDIVVASARAYVSALNKMLGFKSPSASKVSQKSSQASA